MLRNGMSFFALETDHVVNLCVRFTPYFDPMEEGNPSRLFVVSFENRTANNMVNNAFSVLYVLNFTMPFSHCETARLFN